MSSAALVLDGLRALGDASPACSKAGREILGVPAAALDAQARDLRQALALDARCTLAQDLWDSGVHEGSIFGAKLLTQARIRPEDSEVWRILAAWAQGFDDPSLADHASIAGAKRLQADPSRLDEVADWTTSDNPLTRRAALMMTLPWTRLAHPKPEDLAVITRALDWAETYVPDRTPVIQNALGGWLRELSKRDPDRVQAFLGGPAAGLTRGARREASQLIAP